MQPFARLLVLLAPPLLAGCLTTAAPGKKDAAATAAAEIAVGQNAVGEECRLRPAPKAAGRADASIAYDLFCGSWEEPSGTLVETPLAEPLPAGEASRPRLAAEQERTRWAQELARKVTCQAPAWLQGPAGAPAMLTSCELRSGGWPHVAVATGQGKRLFTGDGIPAVGGVLMTAVERLLGGATGSDKPASALDSIRQLEAALGPQALSFGRGDLADFEKLMELGRLSSSVENYRGAEEAYRRALDIQTRMLGPEAISTGDTLMSLALEVSNQGREEEAAALFRRAEPLLQRSFDKAALARLASYKAYDVGNRGDFARALTLTRESSAVRRAILNDLEGPEGTPGGGALLGNLTVARGELIHSLMLEATMALRAGQTGSAEALITEARQIYDTTRGLPGWWKARILTVQGAVQAAKGDLDRAVVHLKQAVQTNYLLFGDSWPVASKLLELGEMQSRGERHDDAVAAFRDAFALIGKEMAPPALLPFDRLAPFLTSAAHLAERTPELRPALHAEMFQAIQLSREGAVGQTITRASARLATDDPKVSELVRQQQDATRIRDRLRLELADETAKPDKDRDRAREAALSTELAASAAKALELERQLQAAFPGYARLTRFQAVPADKVREKLAPGEGLVAFAFGTSTSFGFLVTREGVKAFPVKLSRAQLAEAVGELRQAFQPKGGRLVAFDLAASHALYRKLLEPVAAELSSLTRLVFVPNGALLSLPPAVLVAETPAAERDYVNAAWLNRSKALAVAPSIQAFLSLRALQDRAPAPRPLIAFADPPFEGKAVAGSPGDMSGLSALGQECRTGAPMNPGLLRALTRLAETADEVRTVARTLKAPASDILLGGAVTKAAVRQAPLDQYRVLYFATHGLLPGELRCQSEPGLALAPPAAPPSSPADDGLLTASDIASLRLRADLVVLSACNTAGGSGRFGGEALSGLAEAFFFAGSRALLVTHWQVPSEPTVQLMTGLFGRLGEARAASLEEALALAQADLARTPKTAHPYFWGAFTLVGEGTSRALATPAATAALTPPAANAALTPPAANAAPTLQQ